MDELPGMDPSGNLFESFRTDGFGSLPLAHHSSFPYRLGYCFCKMVVSFFRDPGAVSRNEDGDNTI